jgi:acetyl/propionyl-CoA carboxylase alpha subunit
MTPENDLKINKVLIANRSEIALRIQATCHTLGIKTVAIYSPEDVMSSYVYKASEAYRLSASGFSAYLNQDEIIAIAKQAGVDAIHPGYGFLSENAVFAQKVIDSKILWIGPHPESIKLMGDKSAARDIMQRAGVPVVPGFDVPTCESSLSKAKQFAEILGYPVILKDPLSGGGKAMRMVNKAEDFDVAWKLVLSESKRLTNSSHLLIEKYVQSGRHIEVQFAGNGQNFVHFFERECSIQRRHQKIIEEAPCKFVKYQALEKMYQAALCAAKAVDYINLGTVEFLVTPEEKFYFLEMNTRLQVEHSVTELTCGVDLVALQFYIASSKKLPFTQDDISRKVHAI